MSVETYDPLEDRVARAKMPWWVAAVGGALICALIGWALIAAVVILAILPYAQVDLGPTLELATQFWLLVHGGILDVGGLTITLVPLVLTVMIALLLRSVGNYAGKQAELSGGVDLDRSQAIVKVVAVVMATYASVTIAAVFILNAGGGQLRAGFFAALLAGAMSFFGARRSLSASDQQRWPAWVRVVPQAVVSGVAVALLGGLVVVISSLITHRDQYVLLTQQLNPGVSGALLIAVIQFFFALNFTVWGATWAFGPGFVVGDDSIVSLMGSHVGLLPGFPVTACLPTTDEPSSLLWLIIPFFAGAASAVTVLRRRPRARADETGLVGGLTGVLSGLALVGLAALTGGSLGVDRLAYVGPVLVPLLVIAPCLMGLSGMLVGFIAGLFRRPPGKTDHQWWTRWGEETIPEPVALPEEPQFAVITGEQLPLDFHGDQVE
jgi:hypothetical protein